MLSATRRHLGRGFRDGVGAGAVPLRRGGIERGGRTPCEFSGAADKFLGCADSFKVISSPIVVNTWLESSGMLRFSIPEKEKEVPRKAHSGRILRDS